MLQDQDFRSLPVDEVIDQVGVSRAIGLKRVASLLFTYRCTIACAHCLFNCGPTQPDVRTTLEDGVEFLRQLRETDRVIHVAGGEPMLYYEEMLRICQSAQQEGGSPHFFETNASWCVDDPTTVSRYEALQKAGMLGVLISADPYHQAFVPPERRERAYRCAVEVYGVENVAASNLTREALEELQRIGRNPKALAEYTREHPPRLVSRAGESLSSSLPDRPIEDLMADGLWHGESPQEASCRIEFDPSTMWEIHIDPYGNVQTCCGIIVGNAKEMPLGVQMKKGFRERNELVRAVHDQGPFALLEIAKARGFRPRKAYPQKCHLCWEVRKFLRPYFPDTFGPEEIYSC